MKKIIKKVNKNLSPIENQFGVILEHIDSRLDLLVEGQEALDKKIDKNHGEFNEFRGEINYKFNVVFDELHLIRSEQVKREEFTLLERRLAALEKRVSAKLK